MLLLIFTFAHASLFLAVIPVFEAGGSLVPNMLAGSILDLEPDTEYECRFQMLDPDGVDGTAEKSVTVRTRPEPKPFVRGRLLHAYAAGYKGLKEELAFTGLKMAYSTADGSLIPKGR